MNTYPELLGKGGGCVLVAAGLYWSWVVGESGGFGATGQMGVVLGFVSGRGTRSGSFCQVLYARDQAQEGCQYPYIRFAGLLALKLPGERNKRGVPSSVAARGSGSPPPWTRGPGKSHCGSKGTQRGP